MTIKFKPTSTKTGDRLRRGVTESRKSRKRALSYWEMVGEFYARGGDNDWRWRKVAQDLQQFAHLLTPWETKFVNEVVIFRGLLSEKQTRLIHTLYCKVVECEQ